jgi:dTDP-glucose 4,6-dehydratase
MEKKYKKIIYIDVDETICNTPEDRDYTKSSPIKENIIKANLLYDQDNKVVYWTARGTVTGIDWREVTERQFGEWGVKYHDLKFGKPYYDIFIDDKNMNTKDWE